MADTLTAMVDEIAQRRLSRERARLAAVGQRMQHSIATAMTEADADNMPAVQSEYMRHLPAWTATVNTIVLLTAGFPIGRLRLLGAPDDYYEALLRAVVAASDDVPHNPVWPQPGADRPAWVTEPEPCDCGVEHPGGAYDTAAQCCRVMLFAYEEMVEIVTTEAILRGEIPADDKAQSDEDRAADSEFVRTRSIEAILFVSQIAGSMMPPV